MSVVEMQKVHLAGLKRSKDDILHCLRKNEVIDIQPLETGKKGLPALEEIGKYEFQLAELKSAIVFLESILGSKKSFIDSFVPPKEEITEEEIFTVCREFDCGDILNQCKDVETNLASLKSLKAELKSECGRILPFKSLEVPLDHLTSTANICIVPARIDSRYFDEFENKFSKFSRAEHILVVSRTDRQTYLIIIYLVCESRTINDFISKTNLVLLTLPSSVRTPSREIAHIEEVLRKTESEHDETVSLAKALTKHLNKLKYLYDITLGKKAMLETRQKLSDTDYAFVAEGWVKKEDLERLGRKLKKISEAVVIYPIEPAEGEKVPTAIKNPPLVSPFELVTKMFALPRQNEFDPTAALSFFFALFFGICLGDFGYGLLLTIFCVYFLKRYKLPQGGRNLILLLLIGGIFSILAGVLTGSYFGFAPADVPSAFPLVKNPAASLQILDPIKDPLKMLVVSLILGLIQIFFGMFLAMAQKIRNRRYLEAVIDDGFWIFFLASLLFYALSSFVSPSTTGLAKYMSIAGAVLLVFTQGRSENNFFKKFAFGLLSLYRVSSYLGDTLSYSRLLALGMTSAIIGSVINILAGMTASVPFIGVVLMAVILIVGHLLNLVISTLGAFVHSLRLQLVEFFGKFYEGGGREFRPFKRTAEYTILRP